MNEQTMSAFLREIYRQSRYGVRAHREMDAALPDLDEFWFWSQSFLIAAGNVSKLLWGVNAKAAKRRQLLRERLAVSGSSPLRDRALRNHFEHVDERLEDAVATGVTVDGNVIPSGVIVLSGMEQPSRSFLRNFDPFTRRLSFWHDEFDVDAVARELERVGRLAAPTPLSDRAVQTSVQTPADE